MNTSFHLDWFPPCPPNWPRGGWSVYQINGDQIAKRIVFGADGVAVRRDSWPGYLGIFETLPEAVAVIEAAKKDAGVAS